MEVTDAVSFDSVIIYEDCGFSGDAPVVLLPNCDEDLKPKLGMSFPSFDDGVLFYKAYAQACGFDVRKGMMRKFPEDGTLIRQYIYCNREGFHKPRDENRSSTSRRRGSHRSGCKARISFVFDDIKKCVVVKFVETHSHEMCFAELKVNRNQKNIGPTRAHRLFKETSMALKKKTYATSSVVENLGHRVLVDEKRRKINKLISTFYTCVGRVEGDDDKLDKLADGISNLVTVLESPAAEPSATARKRNLLEMFYGVPIPDHIQVFNPEIVKTKGSCSRLKNRTENLDVRALKPKRKCNTCGEYDYHDSRNCPKKHVV